MTDKKVNGASPCFTLKLGNDFINDPTAVSNAFNAFFSTVADHIGTAKALVEDESIDDIIKAYDSHESIVKIRSHISCYNFYASAFRRWRHYVFGLSVRPSVRPSEAWNTLFWPVHGSVGPPDQP